MAPHLEAFPIARPDSPESISSDAVRSEVDRILQSRHFRSSKRSVQFLRYVVEQKLEGNEENIKERLIGIALFGRDTNYATGEDPVVRVQAKEVRRRLVAYRAELSASVEVLVDLPTGSYVPTFSSRNSTAHSLDGASVEGNSSDAQAEFRPQLLTGESLIDESPTSASSVGALLVQTFKAPLTGRRGVSGFSPALLIGLLCLISLGLFGWLHGRSDSSERALRKFWGPMLESPKPTIISLGRTIAYAPNETLFSEFRKSHPNSYRNRLDEHLDVLPLDQSTNVQWSDMRPLVNIGPAFGGVRAAMQIGSLLSTIRKPFVVRFGPESSFVELRDSPAIIIGSMNTRWTNSLEDGLHFSIRDLSSDQYVQEAHSNRTWRAGKTSQGWVDYGLITREVAAPTGQFLVKFAGVGDTGTEAAGELLTNGDLLRSAVTKLPRNWERKNVQLLVEFNVIDGKAGPPKLIDTYVW